MLEHVTYARLLVFNVLSSFPSFQLKGSGAFYTVFIAMQRISPRPDPALNTSLCNVWPRYSGFLKTSWRTANCLVFKYASLFRLTAMEIFLSAYAAVYLNFMVLWLLPHEDLRIESHLDYSLQRIIDFMDAFMNRHCKSRAAG